MSDINDVFSIHLSQAGEKSNKNTYSIKRDSCLKIRQKADFQKVKKKTLVLNAINPIQEQNHCCLVVWAEHCR